MALHLYRSNRTERLVEALVELLREPSGDPFAGDAVVVHSKGLERYLQHALARGLGICANVRFPFPSQLVQAAEQDPWELLARLGSSDDPALAEVQQWIAGEDRRRVELASQLSRLFERYTWYRPDLDPLPWEAALWEPRPLELVEDLEQRLCLFSVGTLPPALVALLGRLAQTRDVHVLVLVPTPLPGRAHPLLASLGTVAMDFQDALIALDPVLHDTFEDPGHHCALARLQGELLEDRWPAHRSAPSDRSVRVHSCHGPSRQVQVLRDELIWLLDHHPDLQPRDIVVMAPDIGVFAPLVQATLHDQPWLPFRIADRGWDAENTVAHVLMTVLDLSDSRLGASDILDLAELGPVQLRFGLEPDDLPEVRGWVVDAGVRFGADASHRVSLGLPDDDTYTWRFGLDRLLLGQAVSDDALLLGRVPVVGVEGRDERARLGAIVDLAECVIEAVADLDRPRTGPQWRDVLHELLDRLVAVDDDGAWQRRQVDTVLAELAAAPEAGFHGTLDRRGLHRWLSERLGSSEPGPGFLGGAITFCKMVPMRAIPFRVVVLMGLDDGVFPRLATPIGLDRLAADPRPGDRTARDDDRALFLDALLSARDHLVILYSGRDPHDDRVRPPAVPVAELLDHLDPEGSSLVVTHPLQPFAPRAFDGTSPAYDAHMLRAAMARPHEQRPFLSGPLPPLPEDEEVPLLELDRFFRAPIRYLCTRRLGAWVPDEEAGVDDRPPLTLDGLGAWAVRDRVLQHALGGDDLSEGGEAWQHVLASGLLPQGMPGEVQLRQAIREVAALLADRPRPSAPTPVVAELADVRITGRVSPVTMLASRLNGVQRFSGWITHLTRCAAGHTDRTAVFTHRGDVQWEPVPKAEAREALRHLVRLYRWGQRIPLLWFGECAYKHFRRWTVPWGRYREPDTWTRRVLGDRDPFATSIDHIPVPRDCQAPELARALWAPAAAREVR